MDDEIMRQIHISDNDNTCDKCFKPLGSNCIEYGDGDTGYICQSCYENMCDDPRGEGER